MNGRAAWCASALLLATCVHGPPGARGEAGRVRVDGLVKAGPSNVGNWFLYLPDAPASDELQLEAIFDVTTVEREYGRTFHAYADRVEAFAAKVNVHRAAGVKLDFYVTDGRNFDLRYADGCRVRLDVRDIEKKPFASKRTGPADGDRGAR